MATSLSSLLVIFATGCGTDRAVTETPVTDIAPHRPADKALLAATVNGVPIALGDVKELMVAVDGGLSAEEALDALIENELLGDEARRRGYAASKEVEDAYRAALARAVLETRVDKAVTEKTLDRRKLREIYDSEKARFVHGIERRVVHFLVKTGGKGLPDKEAFSIASTVYKEVRHSESEADFMAKLDPFKKAHGKKVMTEKLPPFEMDDKRFVPSFVQAAFAVPKGAHVSSPVKTSFGWHVIYVVEEIPAVNVSFEDAEETLARKVLPVEKEMRAEALLDKLVKSSDVFVVEEALRVGKAEQ